MSTITKLGPADHGRPLSLEEYMDGDYQEGFHYEIIDGRLYVSPEANLPQGVIESWLLFQVAFYARLHPRAINFVTPKARVFVPRRPGLTVPEPDLAAYRGFPLHLSLEDLRWEDFSPILVAEVLYADADKDLIRNVDLYWQVPSIKEYWVIDTRESANEPTMLVHRRQGNRKWRARELNFRDTYTTPLLPGFKLLIDPHG
jgi:Uma2 family endonuclease